MKWNSGEVPSRDRLQGLEAPELTPGEGGRWWSLLCLSPSSRAELDQGTTWKSLCFPNRLTVKHGGPSRPREHGRVVGAPRRTTELGDFQADSLQMVILGLHKKLILL